MFTNRFARSLGFAALATMIAGAVSAQPNTISAADSVITVTVENRNFLDVKIYAVSGLRSWRLGIVNGMNRGTFAVPRLLTSTNAALRVVADPIGSSQVASSHEVLAQKGDLILFRVENHLPLSNAMVIPGN